ncbi:ribonuclease H-like domain-containing protein [Tanacetum coccineum]|uniref:Ribonuclease H-like domain-containing protein n=1 Tax=Tanacetum coccineum TaxID=301880 RepID=A0ABQ5ES35_9ASTR
MSMPFVTEIGKRGKTDSSLFIYQRGSDIAYLLLYVDDIIFTALSLAFLQRVIASLHGEFVVTDLGSLTYFLGISAQRSFTGLFLSQSTFADELLQQVCLYMHDLQEPHLDALKRILRYVGVTIDHGLQLHVSSTSQPTAYTDADWVGFPVTRRSTSSYCVFLDDNLFSWSSNRQVTFFRSSVKAEYIGVANVVAEAGWVRNLLRELHAPLFTARLVYYDNVSVVYLSTNPIQHQRFHMNDNLYQGLSSALFLVFRPSLIRLRKNYIAPYCEVQQVCLYMHDLQEPHLDALKRILRYVGVTIDHGLQLHVSSTSQPTAYTDADWAGFPVTRRSTSGYCVFLDDNLFSWSSNRQVTFSRSSVKAEYIGVANVVAEAGWVHNLLRELHAPLFTARLVYYDNVSVVCLSTNPVQHQRTKHIEIDIYFVCDFVAYGQVHVLHVHLWFSYADIFTKGLPSALFLEFRSSLNVERTIAPTARVY